MDQKAAENPPDLQDEWELKEKRETVEAQELRVNLENLGILGNWVNRESRDFEESWDLPGSMESRERKESVVSAVNQESP